MNGATGTKQHEATMDDVARYAKVVKSTVSHVLNGTAPISAETRKAVLQAVRKLNYRPNSLARGLRQKQTAMLGLIIPDIGNEFYGQIARGAMSSAYKNKFTIVLCSTQYDQVRENLEINRLLEARIDGIMFVGGFRNPESLLAIRGAGVPLVLMDRHLHSSGISCVEYNNKEAISMIVRRMVKAGYRRIGYLSEPLTAINLDERFAGYKAGLAEHDLPFDKSIVFFRKQTEKSENAKREMTSLFDARPRRKLPDALITTSDLIAIGAINALQAHGIRVPGDIAVTGFDNIPSASFVVPSLTTVAQDADTMGRLATEMLIEVIAKPVTEPHMIKLEPQIIVRKSCVLPPI